MAKTATAAKTEEQKAREDGALLADQMIGAAQVFERAAKRLKEQARIMRENAKGEAGYGFILDTLERVELMRMHKHYEVRSAGETALEEIQYPSKGRS